MFSCVEAIYVLLATNLVVFSLFEILPDEEEIPPLFSLFIWDDVDFCAFVVLNYAVFEISFELRLKLSF